MSDNIKGLLDEFEKENPGAEDAYKNPVKNAEDLFLLPAGDVYEWLKNSGAIERLVRAECLKAKISELGRLKIHEKNGCVEGFAGVHKVVFAEDIDSINDEHKTEAEIDKTGDNK